MLYNLYHKSQPLSLLLLLWMLQMCRHDRTVRTKILPTGENCRPHRKGAPRHDGVRTRRQNGQVFPRGAPSREKQVPLSEAAQVPPAPLHVVGHVEEEDVVKLFAEVIHGVAKIPSVDDIVKVRRVIHTVRHTVWVDWDLGVRVAARR